MKKETVLFVCTHNSARSQIAEGLLRARGPSRYIVYSAGTHPSRVHPLAKKAMDEIDIDISRQRSEHVDVYQWIPMDYVVTVCDSAREACPFVPANKQNIHMAFTDPSATEGSESEQLEAFRRARDEIQDWIIQSFESG